MHQFLRNNVFSEKINQQIIKFNEIITELDLNVNLVHELYINYSKAKLNKDSRISKYYIYEDNQVFINFLKGIINIGIYINNQRNEKQKIEKNLNDYFSEIKVLVENIHEEYNSEIDLIKSEILNKIDNNNNKFEEIKNQRQEYYKIKAE